MLLKPNVLKMKFLLRPIPIASLSLLFLVLAARAQDCEVNLDWVGVPPNEYDTRFASISEPDGRPLGFNRSVIPYVTEGIPNPCIRVTGTEDRRVEVMAESTPVGSTMCTYRQGGQLECSNAGIYFCEQATANEVKYEFLCEGTTCERTDVPFFYRFTISPPASEMDPELWCDNRDTGEYPRRLSGVTSPPLRPTTLSGPLPPGETIPPLRPTNQSTFSLTPRETAPPPLPTTESKGSSHNYVAKSVLGIYIVTIATFTIGY